MCLSICAGQLDLRPCAWLSSSTLLIHSPISSPGGTRSSGGPPGLSSHSLDALPCKGSPESQAACTLTLPPILTTKKDQQFGKRGQKLFGRSYLTCAGSRARYRGQCREDLANEYSLDPFTRTLQGLSSKATPVVLGMCLSFLVYKMGDGLPPGCWHQNAGYIYTRYLSYALCQLSQGSS